MKTIATSFSRIYCCLVSALLITLSSCQLETRINPDRIDSEEELKEYLAYGWNTWNNSSVINHVLLPEGLSLQLSFRSTQYSDRSHYISNVLFQDNPEEGNLRIKPIAHSLIGDYSEILLAWKGLTARIQTATYDDDLFILYTPEEIPDDPPILILETGMLWNSKGNIEKQETFIQADLGPRTYGIGATQIDSATPLPIPITYLALNSTVQTGFYTGRKRDLPFLKRFISAREQQIVDKINGFGDQAEVYEAMQNVLSWNTIYDPFDNRVITTGSRALNKDWGGWALFNRDSYFNALMFGLNHKYYAYANAIAMTNAIIGEGFIPAYRTAFNSGKSSDHSHPPLGSMVCKMIYDKYPEEWFLEEVYDELLSWNRWWEKERNNQGYLSWGSDPYTKHNYSNSKQAAMWESGMDQSVLFDGAPFNHQKNVMELASVGLMSLYIKDCMELASIAEILEKTNDRKELLARASKYREKIQELWDEEAGIYRDKNLLTGELSKHIAPTSFYPLICEIPSPQQAKRMVEEHLLNPNEFHGEYMIPSIPFNDSAFSESSPYRGRIHPEMSFLVYLGLRNYDLPEARKFIAQKSLNLLLKGWDKDRSIFNNYNPVSGEGTDISGNDPFHTRGGLLALISLMEAGYWDQTFPSP